MPITNCGEGLCTKKIKPVQITFTVSTCTTSKCSIPIHNKLRI
jgi:hypothetical protein